MSAGYVNRQLELVLPPSSKCATDEQIYNYYILFQVYSILNFINETSIY